MQDRIAHILGSAADLHRQMAEDTELHGRLAQFAQQVVDLMTRRGRLLLCGNGGSAADAQHIAAELSGRFQLDRPALDAEALHTNGSYLTAVGNDLGYASVFARAVEAKGRPGDLLVAISTSGRSENVLQAARKAREIDMQVVAMTGPYPGPLGDLADLVLALPGETPRVQEGHILCGHILCELVEQALYGPQDA